MIVSAWTEPHFFYQPFRCVIVFLRSRIRWKEGLSYIKMVHPVIVSEKTCMKPKNYIESTHKSILTSKKFRKDKSIRRRNVGRCNLWSMSRLSLGSLLAMMASRSGKITPIEGQEDVFSFGFRFKLWWARIFSWIHNNLIFVAGLQISIFPSVCVASWSSISWWRWQKDRPQVLRATG